MRFLFSALFVAICLTSAVDGRSSFPLDLPTGGRGANEAEEDPLETIEFYGAEFEGDAFMFVIDVSGSMAWGGRLENAKEELVQALMSLSSSAEFGIVAFNSGLSEYSTVMQRATNAIKASGAAWVHSLSAYGGTCIDIGTIHGLSILRTSSKNPDQKKLILLGDGAQGCSMTPPAEAHEQVINDITFANWERVSIDTIFVGGNYILAELLFQAIADNNDGAFRIVNH